MVDGNILGGLPSFAAGHSSMAWMMESPPVCKDCEPDMDQPAVIDVNDSSIAASIDDAIMDSATERWQKVAMVVAKVMYTHRGIRDLDIAKRVKRLVASGKLQSQGDLNRMRYSEVRLPSDDESAPNPQRIAR